MLRANNITAVLTVVLLAVSAALVGCTTATADRARKPDVAPPPAALAVSPPPAIEQRVAVGDSPEEIEQRSGTGDPLAGKEKSMLCQGCHNEDGNSTEAMIPKIAGQYAQYIQKQIRNFQSGKRKHEIMGSVAATIVERQDLLDISAWFASQKKMKGAQASDTQAGKKLFLEGNAVSGVYGCVNCHGADGKGLAPGNSVFPVIGGQHKAYLVGQLSNFRKGDRSNDPAGIMGDIAELLSPAEIEAVADYVSGL